MKKSLVSLFLLSNVAAVSLALADPSTITINFTCPNVVGPDIHVLTNFGNKIAGYGTEIISGNPSSPNSPYFTYTVPAGANIPAKLANGAYTNTDTDFDSTTGVVSCNYASSSSFDPFSVSYTMTNGAGGVIVNQTSNTITISQYLGLTH